jgi:hypothetical protein
LSERTSDGRKRANAGDERKVLFPMLLRSTQVRASSTSDLTLDRAFQQATMIKEEVLSPRLGGTSALSDFSAVELGKSAQVFGSDSEHGFGGSRALSSLLMYKPSAFGR